MCRVTETNPSYLPPRQSSPQPLPRPSSQRIFFPSVCARSRPPSSPFSLPSPCRTSPSKQQKSPASRAFPQPFASPSPPPPPAPSSSSSPPRPRSRRSFPSCSASSPWPRCTARISWTSQGIRPPSPPASRSACPSPTQSGCSCSPASGRAARPGTSRYARTRVQALEGQREEGFKCRKECKIKPRETGQSAHCDCSHPTHSQRQRVCSPPPHA
mmetsp:Transcript_9314/g.26485  ORF Transcript_9314/g.26485 Transcript_9314/m.26485 type:complete len:214 (+) Transcript_9314:2149-2790(+)